MRHPDSPSPDAWFDPAPQQLQPQQPAPVAESGPVAEPVADGPEAVRPEVSHLGDRAPTYAAEPGALPPTDPAAIEELTPDTVLEGARYGTYTLRAASLRGDSARYRGEARRDFLLTARFGSGDDALVLVALAGGDRAAPGAAEAAAELCRTVASAVGRSQERLADDIRAGRRDALRSGLQRLTDRGTGDCGPTPPSWGSRNRRTPPDCAGCCSRWTRSAAPGSASERARAASSGSVQGSGRTWSPPGRPRTRTAVSASARPWPGPGTPCCCAPGPVGTDA